MTNAWEEGDPDAKLLVLGESPARVEMRLGRPLVGPSGEVFNDCLHTEGIARRQLYILNLWPFPVTKDKEGNIYYGSSTSGDALWQKRGGFTSLGLELSSDTLARIEKSGANNILTLGQQAMSRLTGDRRPIMKWRGSPLWSDVVKRKFIPTVHPAATLHGTYLWRFLIMSDMRKWAADRDVRELNPPERNLIIRPNFADVYHYFHKCHEAGRVCTDIEVFNHQVSCFSLSCDKGEAMTVPLLSPTGGDRWDEDEEIEIWKMYGRIMSDPDVMKINQNIVGFDATFLFMQNNLHMKGRIGDTMIAQHIMYPEFNKGLDFIASVHTREPYWKDDGKIWKNPNIDYDTFQRYCGRDACVTLEAWDVLSQEMTDGGYWPTYDRTIRLAGPICYMTTVGLAVDREGLANTKVRLEKLIAEKQKELDDATSPIQLNVNSPLQCRRYFYEHLGLPPYKGPSGGISTDDKAMARIARKEGPGSQEARLVAELRKIHKLKGTYVEVELDKDNRVRCSWNPRGTWTGRLSSGQTVMGTGMNLQNLHPQFKSFIVAG